VTFRTVFYGDVTLEYGFSYGNIERGWHSRITADDSRFEIKGKEKRESFMLVEGNIGWFVPITRIFGVREHYSVSINYQRGG